jgi:hypothetical protein
MPVQSTVTTQAQVAVAGQMDSPCVLLAPRIAAAALTVGLVACLTSGADTIRHLEAPAADPDAFATAAVVISSASPQTVAAASFDGAVGATIMRQARNVTLTLSSSADWDATTAIVYGLDEQGAPTSESLTIPNGGNATVSGLKLFSSVTSLYIPAQSGTGGTATMGFGSVLGPLDGSVAGIVPFDVSRTGLTYAANEAAPVVRKGRVWVSSETAAYQGREVYVRMVAGGGESLGAIRATPDANDCALLRGARFASTNSAAGFVLVELNLP